MAETGPGAARRLLVRAELVHDQRSIVSHTLEISESTVLVQTDELARQGDRVDVCLGFPGCLESLSLQTRFAGHVRPSGPGKPAGWSLEFVLDTDDDRERLRAWLAQLDTLSGDAARELGDELPTFRILLVEDSAITRDVFAHAVQNHFQGGRRDIRLDFASDGEQAWDMLRGGSYDLAIVDCFLPSLDGDSLIGRLRGTPEVAKMSVVAVSLWADRAQSAVAAGADVFLQKPIAVADLISTINLLASSRKHAHAR